MTFHPSRRPKPQHARAHRDGERRRRAFTLVEMLVSVAIVALMMVLFAEVFSLAGGSVSKQKGIARNDSRSRTVLNILRNDLDNRTFRTMIPFAAGETDTYDANDPLRRAFGNRRGFFSISENDPVSGTDDVLQFVIEVDANDPIFGRAEYANVGDGNEPDYDDGIAPSVGDPVPSPDTNKTGSSQYAIVSYFLRYGVLYRRVLLIRKPLDSDSEITPTDWALLDPTMVDFWDLFDYSAHFDTGTMALVWHGVNSTEDWLDNLQFNALGDPRARFGHNFADGNPREYDDNGVFLGRFTHQETSDPDFDWPMNGASNQPFDPADMSRSEILNAIGVVDAYSGGRRRAEDILMQHVHEFDVKVFDESVGVFVDIGGAGAMDYLTSNNTAYTSNNPTTTPPLGTNIYDTWHPSLGAESPFRPATGDGADMIPGNLDDPDPKPLRAIQIRIRFFDPQSGQMRQMTLRHALTFADQ